MTMTRMGRSRGASQTVLLVAVGVALVLVALVLLVARSSPPPAEGDSIDPGSIPDITGPVRARDLREGPGLTATTDARVLLKRRDDPGTIAWSIEFASLEPSADGRVVMDAPRAWYFVGRDTAIYVRSDSADFAMQDLASEPESGRFTGDVQLWQVARLPDGSLPSPEAHAGGVRVLTPWLEFDSVAGEIHTTDLVLIRSETMQATCQGLTAVLNEVDGRIEFMEVPGSLIATITPGGQRRQDTGPAPSAPTDSGAAEAPVEPAGVAQAQPDEPGSGPGSEQFYAATFERSVRISQPKRRVFADRGRAWVRLVDNRFESESLSWAPAERPLPLEAALVSLALAGGGQPGIEPGAGDGAEDGDADGLDFGAPIEFSCQGPSTVRPMSERPAALGSGDEMAVRLESDAPGRVRFEDDGLAAVGHAAALEYALTTRLLVLEGTAEAPIVAAVAESGTLTAQSVTLGLGTGVGQATGAGRLEAAEPTRWISWQDQADVVFRVREGWMTGSLEQAIASGAVELHDGESWAKGQDLNARFADGGSSAPIERAVLTGDAQAAARRGEVQARRLDVRFAVDGDRSRPVLAVATGDVVGRQGDRTVRAGQLEADLAPEQDQDAGQAARSGAGDRVAVTTARARDGVRYDREDGSFGQGESMLVDAAGRTVRIEGSPGVVGGRGAVVESGLILLDDASDTIHTPGAGRLTVRPDDDQTQGAETVRAQWSGSMLYRDSTGELEVSGRVQIETPTPGGLDTIRAARVTAIIEPAAQASDEADGAAGGPASGVGRGRRLISAVALGEAEPASVEMQRDLPGAGPAGGAGRPARLTALLGARIEADNAAGVLTVPSAGRLLLSDSRAAAADEPDGGDLRGSALFDWEGSMVFDRPAGRAQMRRGVRMVHRPQDAESGVMELECEVLSGQFVEAEPLSEGEAGLLLGSGGAGELRSVEASGAVWARSGPRQMLSDRMVYDPATGGATATAEPGGWVTMFDQARSTPVTAGELLWSLQSGRIEVRRPSPVSVPR